MAINHSLNSALHALASTPEERRAAVLLEEQEREAVRQKELESQSSSLNDPQERIRIWERLHMLRLPLATGHRLVRLIATQTQLTVKEVQEEQQRRASSASAPPASGLRT